MDLRQYLDDFTRRDWQETTEGGPVRFAVVGLGWWVRDQTLPAIAASELCEATVLVDLQKESAKELAENRGVEHALDAEAFHAGAAQDAYDAVYICTPNATHLPYVETGAGFEKDILCEKPMEAGVERAEKIVDAVEKSESTLMVGYRMHTEPAVRRLRELLRDGIIGDPVHVHGHKSQPLLRMNPNPDQWRLDPELAGRGGTVTDIGIYPLNTARFLLEDDPVAVQATMRSEESAFADVPDEHASFTLEFPRGVTAVCTASQASARASHLTIVGTDGRAQIDPAFSTADDRRLLLSRGTTTVETTFHQVDQMREEFDYFADCLLSGRHPEADAAHGLVDMRVMEAVYDAAETGKRHTVDLS